MKHYLSVADFVVIFDLVDRKIKSIEQVPSVDLFDFYGAKDKKEKIEEKRKEHIEKLRTDAYYQRLLKIREHLENLNIDIDVPEIKIKGE